VKALIAIGAGGLVLAFLALRCRLGVHGPARMEFVGDSWNPDLYIRACARCGHDMPEKGVSDD
jgi:hypothetical protein